ncbi:hypothetical protein JW752_00610 [Candidatus Peregrinibacteria bacterium]|nr:hypothetical protein [Candidatus Peregrinibacteria bacterium]
MADQGDLELFTGPAPSEKKEMGDEQFRDEMKRTQQALKQLQQEEGQAKAHDNSLAAIIVQFLNQPQNTDLFLLVSRTVAQNLPSELIIAILSLVDRKAAKEVKGLLEGGETSKKHKETALTLHQKADFQALSPEHKKAIDHWTQNMLQVAAKKPHRVLESLVVAGPERKLSPMPIQLSAFILRNYLAGHQIDIEFQLLHDFMQGVFVEMVKNLEEQVKGQKQLEN